MPPDRIFFNEVGSSGTTIRHISPAGTGVTNFATLDERIATAAPNPAVTQFAFFYTPTLDINSTQFGYQLFRNSTPSRTGASTLNATKFVTVGTIQYTPDGSSIIFTAAVTEGSPFKVYRVSATGGTLTDLGAGEEAFINPAGNKIAVTRLNGGFGDIGTMNVDGTGFVNLTNTLDSEDINPQWSKDGTQIFFASNQGSATFDIFRMSDTGTNRVRLTTANVDEFGPSPNTSGLEVSFTVLSGSFSEFGLYKVNISTFTRTPLFLSSSIRELTFWTPVSAGDSVTYMPSMLGGRLPSRIAMP